ARLLEDRDIFGTDGGVTFSGGEPLMQHEFVRETARLLKNEGIHLALETSSFAPEAVYRETVPLFDCVMADVKLFDGAMHETYTGVKNDRILANLRWLMQSGKDFVLRVPLIPGITDTDENLCKIAEFAGEHAVELLPYNSMAGAKYAAVGREFSMTPAEKQASDKLSHMVSLFRNARVK
ncbi:MAG: radical SAM protein, partial [Clostridia bacterium]|nr:radical SAM protein [Clostridia bacterium]